MANLTKVQEDELTLLMAQMCNTTEAVESATAQVVLNEVHAQAYLGHEEGHQDDKWYLDIGASNHMSGCKENFAELDSNIKGPVKFGDSSSVGICGQGTVMFTASMVNIALSQMYTTSLDYTTTS